MGDKDTATPTPPSRRHPPPIPGEPLPRPKRTILYMSNWFANAPQPSRDGRLQGILPGLKSARSERVCKKQTPLANKERAGSDRAL